MIYSIEDMRLDSVLKFSQKLNSIVPDSKMTFDFSKIYKFDPLPMLMMSSIIRNYRLKYPKIPFNITWSDQTGKSYAGTMGFFKAISKEIDYGKSPGEANGSNNYIPITEINFNHLIEKELEKGQCTYLGNLIEEQAGQLARVVDRGNEELHKLLTYLIREIMRNTPEHAGTDKVWICGQYWKTYDLAEIAILDEGIGIFKSITKNSSHRKYINDNLTALKWSLKPGISDAFKPSHKQKSNDVWANSGFGLFMVSEICKYLNGSFCLISYDDYILIDNHGLKIGNTLFKGTAIRIKVPCKKDIDAKKIISTIASEGELQSANIRNAFKKASIPSRGFIDELNSSSFIK